MRQYHEALKFILENGTEQENRTGTNTIMFPTVFMRFDMDEGFPAVTTKKLAWKAVKGENIGFLKPVRSAAAMRELGCKVWDQNANENKAWLANPNRRGEDDLGDVYGAMWREWPGYRVLDLHDPREAAIAEMLQWNGWQDVGKFVSEHEQKIIYSGNQSVTNKRLFFKEIDMLGECIQKLILEPTNRRILFHAWNPAQLDSMALPPCHLLYQFLPNIAKGELSLSMTQRSADFFLGVPFNIASAALLLHVVARMTGFKPKYVNLTFNDAHIYVNHLDQVKEQLSREARPLPKLAIKNWTYQDPEGMLSLQHIRTFFRCTDTGQATKEEILGGMVAKAIAHLGELNPDWFTLEGYDPHPALTAPMAV